MASSNPTLVGETIRFGEGYELDLRQRRLRRGSRAIKLERIPLEVLVLLVEHTGEIVVRDEIVARVWGKGVFLDTDNSIRGAIRKLRQALRDDAESPRFIQTVVGQGYRFIAPIEGHISVSVATQPLVELPPPAKSRAWGKPWRYRVAVLCAVFLSVGVLVWTAVSRTSPTPKVVRFTKLTSDGQRKFGSLVTDGVRIYFNESLPDGRSIIAQVSIKGGEAVPLSVPLKSPSVRDLSKDGTELLIASAEGQDENSIWVQPVAGGSPIRVGTIIASDAAFGADGMSIIYGRGNNAYSVNRDGSSPRTLFTVKRPLDGITHFRFSPDAKTLRFSQLEASSGTHIVTSAAVDGTGAREMFDGASGNWTPDGRFFIFPRRREDYFGGYVDIWATREKNGFPWRKQRSEPMQLTSGPFEFWSPLPSKDGKQIYAVAWSPRAEVIRYYSRHQDFAPYLAGISAEGLAFSPDGQWVAYITYPDGILWRSRVDSSERRQLTSLPMKVSMPRWSPDGRQIAFTAILPSITWNVYVTSSEGGNVERVLPSEESQNDVDWAPDGKSLVFGSSLEPNRPIYILNLTTQQVALLPGSEGFVAPRWSPDGRYIAGTILGSQSLMLFDVSAQKWTKPCDCTVDYPVWSRDGKYLYFLYYPPPDAPYRIVRLRMSDLKIETAAEISKIGRFAEQWFGLAPDGSPLLARDISTQEIYALDMEWP
jgi:Tol biopolymer transport system component/DNA-binding winged helix-turn-helix (wHTH) protein